MSNTKIIGRVDSVSKNKNTGTQSLSVHAHAMGKNYSVRIPSQFTCWIQKGDTISAVCDLVSVLRKKPNPKDGSMVDIILTATRPPWVEVGVARKTVTDCFLRFLAGTGFGNRKAEKLYEILMRQATVDHTPTNIAQSQEMVVSYMNYISAKYNKDSDEEFFPVYTDVVTEEQFRKLLKSWYGQRSVRRLYLLGLEKKEIRELSHMSHDAIYLQCMDNPFVIPQIDLKKAKEIFHRIGKDFTIDDFRRGTIVRKIWEEVCRGNTGILTRQLKRSFPDLLDHEAALIENYGVVVDRKAYYLQYQHEVEVGMAKFLAERIYDSFDQEEERPEPSYTITTLTKEQQKAVKLGIHAPVSNITGPPGCGKTLTIREIIHNLELLDIPFAVASFTGKAVARLREVVGSKEISTMHKMIAKPPKETFDVLILDEVSMITTELMWKFMQRFGSDFRIILVGDIEQLPPISWGNLFSEIIASNIVDTVRLTKNYRVVQGYENNGILENAKAISNWDRESPDCPDRFEFVSANNFTVVEGGEEMIYEIINGLRQLGNTSKEIRVISPYNKPLKNINSACQQIYNGDCEYVIDSTVDATVWMVGDLVAMTRNNYDINVMNGEEGEVVDVSLDKRTIDCSFEGHGVFTFKIDPPEYNWKDNDDWTTPEGKVKKTGEELNVSMLIHCFGISCHRSQGSEFKHVIFYLEERPHHGNFINKNLIYTALTRAKDTVYVVGDIEGILLGCTTSPISRYDALADRIGENVSAIMRERNPPPVKDEGEVLIYVRDEFDDFDGGDW